ncbi:MAG: peptidoglycan-binding domain-containing protein [Pseudomonadota bacterium]
MKKNIHHLVLALICCCLFTFVTTSATMAAEEGQPSKEQVVEKAKATPIKAKAAKSEKVKAIQEALNKAGFDLKVDGHMGKTTRNAIKKFQKDNGLKATGRPNKATLAKLGI